MVVEIKFVNWMYDLEFFNMIGGGCFELKFLFLNFFLFNVNFFVDYGYKIDVFVVDIG